MRSICRATLPLVLCLCVVLLSVLQRVRPLGQPYSPIPVVQTATSCSAGTTFFTLGTTNATVHSGTSPLKAGTVYLVPFNNSVLGGVILQLALAVGDNSAALTPIHLRLGLFAIATTDGFRGASLVVQTAEITLYPSGPGTVYGSLPSPYTILLDSGIALGLWSDSSLTVPLSVSASAGYTASGYPYASYVDYSMPESAGNFVVASAPAIAATGCLNPAFLTQSALRVYGFCSYMEQYNAPPTPPSLSNTATTTLTQISGSVVIDTAAAVGSGYAITTFGGLVQVTTAGLSEGFHESATITYTFSLYSGRVGSVAPSNALYPSAPVPVDGSGIAIALSNGQQLVLQYNSTTSQYQTVSSDSTSALSSAAVSYSGAFLLPITSVSAVEQAPSCVPPTVYTPDPAVSCPVGSAVIQFGDVSNTFVIDGDDLQDGVGANAIYFRSFSVAAEGTVLYQLQYVMYEQPGAIVHMRIGVFAGGGSATAPRYALLAQTAQITLANPTDVLVQANLASPLPLPIGAYALGVWFDTSVYASLMIWETNVFATQVPYTAVSSSGSLPAAVTSQLSGILLGTGAVGCAPSVGGTTQLAFCAAFTYPSQVINYFGLGLKETVAAWTSVYSGVLTVLSQRFTNSLGSYHVVVAANGTATLGLYYSGVNVSFSLSSFASPASNLLYDPSTTSSGLAVDASGLQFQYAGRTTCTESGYYEIDCGLQIEPGITIVSAVPAASNQSTLQESTAVWLTGVLTAATPSAALVSFSPYTPGFLPACHPPTAPKYNNTVSPPSPAVPTCLTTGTVGATLGDVAAKDFSVAASLAGNTMYTNTFAGVAGTTLSTVGVSVGSNIYGVVRVVLAVYDPANTLVGQSGVVTLTQVTSQHVLVALLTSVAMTIGSYTFALVSDSPLNISTSAQLSPTMAAPFSSSLPASFAASGSAGALPLTAFGCAPMAYSFCAMYQFYAPDGGKPQTMTYLYEGMLATTAGGSNSHGSYVSVLLLAAHLSVLTHQFNSPPSYTSLYYELTAAEGAVLYPSSTMPVDSTGLTLISPMGYTTTLSYSAATGLTDSAGVAAYGAPVVVVFNMSAVPSSPNTVVPECNVLNLPSLTVPPPPAAPSCLAGQTLLSLGNEFAVGLEDDTESFDGTNSDFIALSPFTTGNTPSVVSQVGVSILANWNVVARATFALYDGGFSLLSTTNEVVLINPGDQHVVGVLFTPQTLQTASTYWVGVWTDSTLWMPYGTPLGGPCMHIGQYITNGSWPASFTGPLVSACYGATLAVFGFGCSLPPSAAGSTGVAGSVCGDSSCSDVSLSAGAVAGIVIGCVVGTNVLLLLCLWLICGGCLRTPKGSIGGGMELRGDRFEPSSPRTSRLEMTFSTPSGTRPVHG